MRNYKVSIVICTYNRAPFLARTLDSLRNLNYKNFEVVVVNGPSTDETEQILEGYKGRIKIRNNQLRNLSVSRNIGIKASSGDIIAFIDDDAIPEPEWLDDLLSLYTDESIGGVGGKVYGPGGDHFQFTNGIINIWGEAIALRDEPGDFNDKNGEYFNIMMGTNSSFRRKALEAVGGFDEYYEYFHDESDLAVRIIKAGFKIKHHPRAYIHHEFARSHIRTNIYKLNWYPIIKNTVYFGLKNSEGYASLKKRKNKVMEVAKKRLTEFENWYRNGLITKEDYNEFIDMWNRGWERGYEDGLNLKRQLNFDLDMDSEFMLYIPPSKELHRNGKKQKKMNICLLSQDYPPNGTGGIAMYTWQLAKGFVQRGHNVHIITKHDEQNSWLQEGVNIHTVKEYQIEEMDELTQYSITNKNINYSYAIYKKIKQIDKQYKIDIIETPIWDYEGLVAAKLLDIPIVTRLETPLLKAVETQNWDKNYDIMLSADLEKKLIELSDGIISISNNIKDTISSLYNIDIGEKSTVIYLGLDKKCDKPIISLDYSKVKILFVGRLERRKGIHVLLEIIPRILKKYPNVEINIVGNDTIPNDKGITYKEEFVNKNSNEEFMNRINFLGKVDDKELNNQYKNCDIFVAPSLYESFGIVFLEAMRYGKPVIGCKAGGMQEIIIDGKTGLLANPNDPNSLYEKISILVENREYRNNLGVEGFKRFNEIFTQDKMVTNTLDYYSYILDNKI